MAPPSPHLSVPVSAGVPAEAGSSAHGPLVQIELRRRELSRRYGLSPDPVRHFRRPREQAFTESQRADTTVLLGGLSPRHDRLVEAAVQSLGYRCKALPNVTLHSYELAKEYGNNGLCNPTYFTVGNLVHYVQDLEAAGMSRQEIIDSHVFLTAGSCGTCRFGMYEAEYRLALANAGFDGFRILTFGTDEGIDQRTGEKAGLDLNTDFFLALVQAFNVADVLNQFQYKIRAYEVEPGSVDAVTGEVLDDLYELLRNRRPFRLEDSGARVLAGTGFAGAAGYLGKFLHMLSSPDLPNAMADALRKYDRVEIDPFRVKPIVKLTGEFWAQTTEGAGNFHMHRFLEREGAEVYVDRSLFMRIAYMLFHHQRLTMERKGLRAGRSRLAHYRSYYRKRAILGLAERILKRENDRLIAAMGHTLHPMIDHYELERLAQPYWDWRTSSGESHLEIAENIYYHQHHLAHMVLSLKPFTCMPSTQSDGVQAKVVERFPGMIFLPIETSGDGEVIAHSRVQMALGSARVKARKEFADAVAATGRTLDELKAFVDDRPELTRPSFAVPHHEGVAGRAANFALHVGNLIGNRPVRVSAGLETIEPETAPEPSEVFP